MTLPIKTALEGVLLFAEQEIIPALGGWRTWAATAALVLFNQRAEAFVKTLADNKFVAALGLIDGDAVDTEAALSALKQAARTHKGLKLDIPMLGEFEFFEKDIDALRGCLAQVAGTR